jgi:hypothetical protein
MSVSTESKHAKDSAACIRMASSMRESGVSLEALLGITDGQKRLKAASYTGMAAAHTEASANLTAAKRISARTFAGDAEYVPVSRNGQPLRGSSRQRYVQGYARGRTESAQVDDPSAYLELAVAASKAVPLNRDAYYALARGRADGARRTLAERRDEERAPTPSDDEMSLADGDRVAAGEAEHRARPVTTRAI